MAETIYPTFLGVVRRQPERTALLYRERGQYAPITYQALSDAVDAIAASLHRFGIRKGDAVGIFSENRPEWVMADLAAMKQGAVVVPIYPSLPGPQVQYIVNHSRIRLIFADKAKRLSLLSKIRAATPNVRTIVLFDAPTEPTQRDVLAFGEMLRCQDGPRVEAADVRTEDVATIVYTSGTTGDPKGVMLTHTNIVSNARAVAAGYDATPDDVTVSYLPLAHMFERTCGYYAMLFSGASIAYANHPATLARDVAAVRPTVLLAVPRVLEKACETAAREIAKGGGIRRRFVRSAIATLNEYVNRRYKQRPILPSLRIKRWIYDRLVAAQFRRQAGGRLRLIVSGGAALRRDVAKIFHILGFTIVQGYGLTETSPVVCSNTPEDNRLGTVGRPMQDVHVRLGPDDEILVRGPNLMAGYLGKPEETRRVIDEEGWFHTGDQGQFDEAGHLIITGRIKEIIVTSQGKNIAPASIEAMILRSDYVQQVMLHGDRRKHLVALIVPNRNAIKQFAEQHALDVDPLDTLLNSKEVRALIGAEIARTTADTAPYEKVKGFALLPDEWSVADGLLTPTLKLKRQAISERYRSVVESLYEGRGGKSGGPESPARMGNRTGAA